MKKVRNPFAGKAGRDAYHCFGCSPENSIGLHLEFWLDGEDLVAVWQPNPSYEGWSGILHGGIQATLMDEAAAWLVFVGLKTAGVTMEMNTRYLKPVYTSKGQIKVRATLLFREKRTAKIKCQLEDGIGTICATSDISYFCFPEKVARAKYHYPGADAFFDESKHQSPPVS